MSKSVQPVPPGREHLIPHLVCSPCAKAIDFYKKAFGAEEVGRLPSPDGRIMHASLLIGGDPLFLNDDFPEHHGGKATTATALGGSPVTIHRYVPNTDAAIKRAQDAGATVVMPAADMFWGDRYGIIVDPFGHKWSFSTQIKVVTGDEVQAAMKEACGKPG